MKNNATTVVIFIFIKDKKILIEKRYLEIFKSEQYLIPGGTVQDELEDLEQALKREALEELGITLIEFIKLPTKKEIRGLNGQLLIPFFVTKWLGNFPESILDKGNKIEWVEIDQVLKSLVKPTKIIARELKKYLL